MEILVELLKSVVALGFIAVIGLVMAILFIAILALATGIDNQIQQEEDRAT